MKTSIESIIYDRGIVYPYKIEAELRKLKISDELMPKLKQIQTYIKKRRIALGDSNNLKRVENFINPHQLSDKLDENDLFVVDHEKLGNGSDEKPLRLGFTTKHLFKNTSQNQCVFHIDLTYKIVKQSYPLLVFKKKF